MKSKTSPPGSWWSSSQEGIARSNPLASALQSEKNRADRLLIVAREMKRGGAAYLALRHARRLSTVYAVDVLVTGPCDDDFVAEFPEQVTIYRLDGSILKWDADWRRVLHIFAHEHSQATPFLWQYHTLLATSTFPDLIACAAVCTVQASKCLLFLVDESLAFYSRLGPQGRSVVKQCVERADLVLPVSRRLWYRMAEHCPVLLTREWQSLPPPVDVETIIKRAGECQTVVTQGGIPNVVTVARLSPEKQIPLCVLVHHRLKEAGVRFRWYVIGDGPDELRVRAEIRDHGMTDDFVLLGKQDNVFSILKSCDVFALFSRSEGCPTVVLEALALGLPVIMTDISGSDEMIAHETTGLIVTNDFEAIASGLARIVEHGDFRQLLRANIARTMSSRQGPDLLSLIDNPGPPAPVPRVTILIPTYNQEPFIDKAIASALGQDYPSLEVVVLDDASTDGTGPAARAWVFDRRFRYVRNEHNLGRVSNYRRGLTHHARGEWVLMLDGDDYLADPGFIGRACKAIGRHRDRPIVFAQAGHRVHHLDGRRGDEDVLPPIAAAERVLTGADYLRFVFETSFFTHLGSLYRRLPALQTGSYTAQISSSDMDSLLRLALEGEVLLLNEVAGYWVQHGSNTSAHLPLKDLGANVRIFRRVARQAVRRGLSSWAELDVPLTRYEVRTMVYLFNTMIGDSARGPLDLVRFLGIAFAINPALLRDERFLKACRGYARILIRPAFERGYLGRSILFAFRLVRAVCRRFGGKAVIKMPVE
jgi:glycosyltransferase involved in cell wall biosynthesis